MKIKKYEATTEQEAIEKVKDELGLNALILSIKKTQPKGMLAWFKRPVVEVTAAYEDAKTKAQAVKAIDTATAARQFESINEQQQKISNLEYKLSTAEELLEKVITRLSIAEQRSHYGGTRKYENNMLQVFYDTFLEQGVVPDIAEKLLEDVDIVSDDEKININLIVKIVYNTIINILGQPEPIRYDSQSVEGSKIIAFIGPTGVGKTTTIAKLSSHMILNDNLRVGLITADTYRIAAVEQLKTYAEILGLDVGIAYNGAELNACVSEMRSYHDVIFIDTAGRSHKNNQNFEELSELLQNAPECDKYLVLSLTTKYEDLLSIVNTYANITDFHIIFTKLDETICLGSIINICYLTGKRLSYVTNGQNVPDDIEILRPDRIAKALLGMGGH